MAWFLTLGIGGLALLVLSLVLDGVLEGVLDGIGGGPDGFLSLPVLAGFVSMLGFTGAITLGTTGLGAGAASAAGAATGAGPTRPAPGAPPGPPRRRRGPVAGPATPAARRTRIRGVACEEWHAGPATTRRPLGGPVTEEAPARHVPHFGTKPRRGRRARRAARRRAGPSGAVADRRGPPGPASRTTAPDR
ncbi:hypothetical protein [Streptomyces roseolilacinus]|uniref:hypothetical protein n=1 Tax=Streptomyces roseolilacinus TaxID=66904 RepID=UPI00382735EE